MANDGSVKIGIEIDDDGAAKKLKKVGDEAEDLGESAEDAADGLKKTEKGLDGVSDSSGDTKKGINILDIAMGSLVAGGLSSFVSGAIDAAKSLIALAEETKEYREDMAKLQTAFKSTGKSVDSAEKAYQDFYAILGESDRAVEAVNHLAELTNNTEELAQWSTIAAGVTAKFGDSLPIEGLTEAANETAKVGQVTGVLADALTWAGVSEDAFNESLASCTTEQERSALITETLNGLYSEAAAEYNSLTASTQAANRATAELQAQQAKVGAVVEPLTTLWTNYKANALEASVPVLAWVSEGLQTMAANAEAARNGTDLLSESQRASLTAAEAAAESFRKTGEAAAQLASVQISNVDYVANNLLPQLQSLVDANGQVKESDEARAQFILEQLNQALGTEYESIQQIIDANGRVKESVYEVIEAKKAQILLTSYEDAYREAIDGVREAEERRAIAAQELALQEEKHAAAQANLKRVREEYQKVLETGNTNLIRSEGNRVAAAQKAADNEETILNSKIKAYSKAETDLALYYATIDGYEQASTAVMAGETGKALGYLTALSEGFMTAEKARAEAAQQGKKTLEEQTEYAKKKLEEQVVNTTVNLELLKSQYAENQESMTAEQKKQMEARIKQAETEAENAYEEFYKIGGDITKGMAAGADGEEKTHFTLSNSIKGLVNKAVEAAKTALDSHSPSKRFEEIFYSVPQGAAVGVERETDEALEAVATMTDSMLKTAEKGTEDIAEVIAASEPELVAATESIGDAINAALQSSGEEQKKTVKQLMQDWVSLSESYEKEVADIWANLDKDIASARESYERELESTAKSIMGRLGLFDSPDEITTAKGEDLSKNLADQVNLLETYNDVIAALRERGLSEAFMDELTQLGVDATGELQGLSKMTDEELTNYVQLWEQKSALARQAAEEELKILKDETEAQIKELTDTANAEYSELKTEYEKNAKELAEQIKNAMIESGEAGYTELIAMLSDYTSAGESLMDSVTDGVEAAAPAFLSKVSSIASEAQKILSGAVNESKAHIAIDNPLGEIISTVAAEQSRVSASASTATSEAAAIGAMVDSVSSMLSGVQHSYNRTSSVTAPVVIELDKRELGRAVVELSTEENTRIDAHVQY